LLTAAIIAGLEIKFGLLALPTCKNLPAMNSLMVILPHKKYEGRWGFEDPAVGLHREPFVAGIDTLIGKASANIPDAQHGFRAIFCAAPSPTATFQLQWRGAESGR
jgi:hypothetical protein